MERYTYQSYTEYVNKSYAQGCVVESRLEGTHNISLIKMKQGTGAYPDPPLPELYVGYGRRNRSRGQYNLGNGYFDVLPNVIGCAIAPPRVATDYVFEGGLELLIVGIPEGWLSTLTQSILGKAQHDFGKLHSHLQSDRRMFQLVEQLHYPDTLASGNALLVDGLTMALVGRLVTLSHTALKRRDIPALDKALLSNVETYLQDRLAENPTLDELATLTGMSVYEFSKRFKTATGVSAYQYVLDKRLERAKTLVRDTRLSLAEIAYSVGFSSQAHMTKVFREREGYTPACYREGLA